MTNSILLIAVLFVIAGMYLWLGDCNNYFLGSQPRPSIKDLGGLIAIEYRDHTT